MSIWTRKVGIVPVLGILAVSAACGGGEPETAQAPSGPAAEVAAAPAAAAPAQSGQVIEVKMSMVGGSQAQFEPSQVSARPGDVIRFVNVDNVHNVSFPADKNAGKSGLPAPSPFLTTPGQTYDYTVSLAPGSYTFQCDPHVAMGMVGTLKVAS